jgi:dTDP-4-amino-4,6-dideoxygalactose transaminase
LSIGSIPVAKPLLPSADQVLPWLHRIDENRNYTNYGPLVLELKDVYSSYFGVSPEKIAILSSATTALQAALEYSQIQNWFIPDFTFVATALAIVNAKKNLHLLDVEESDWRISENDIRKNAIFSSSVGIIPVIPFGDNLKLGNYEKYPNVIVDAAASMGSINTDLDSIPENWCIVFSLHATKVLSSIEGGVAVCGNSRMANFIERWGVFGFGQGRITENSGTNAKLSELHAAYGLASMHYRNLEMQRWSERLSLIELVTRSSRFRTFLTEEPGIRPYWIIRTSSPEETLELRSLLAEAQIETRPWWPSPISQMPYFREGFRDANNPVASMLSSTIIGLPIYQDLNLDSITKIAEIVG